MSEDLRHGNREGGNKNAETPTRPPNPPQDIRGKGETGKKQKRPILNWDRRNKPEEHPRPRAREPRVNAVTESEQEHNEAQATETSPQRIDNRGHRQQCAYAGSPFSSVAQRGNNAVKG